MSKLTRNPVITEIANKLGSYQAIATAVGRKRATISCWTEVPPEYVLTLEKLSGVKRTKIRPDIFGSGKGA